MALTTTTSSRLDYILSRGQVPRLHKRQTRRKVYEKFEGFVQGVLEEEHFCVLVDGISGSGKTNLVCDLLWHRSDICGHYFKNIVWLTDRNLEPNNVASLGLDALLLIPNALPFNLTDSDQTDSGHSLHEQLLALQRPQTIRIMLSKSLAENPKTLLIVDDVYLQETVDLFANLRCSTIFTSTRSEIFDHIDNCRSFHLRMDDVYPEDVKALCYNYDIDSIGDHSARDIIRLSGGNFALLEKLLSSARSDTQQLQILLDRIQFGQLNTIKCTSYYQYSSLNTSFDIMIKAMDERFAKDLPTLAVLQPSTWIDVEVVSLVWPVDVPGSGQANITLLVSKDMHTLARNSFVEQRTEKNSVGRSDQTRIEPILHYYLLSTADQQAVLNTLIFFKKDLQRDKKAGSDVERSCKKYWIDNENNIQQLETWLRQPKRRIGASSFDSKASTSWFSNWLAYFWSK